MLNNMTTTMNSTLSNDEKAEYLDFKVRNGEQLTAAEEQLLASWVTEKMKSGSLTAVEVKSSNGVVIEKKASFLARAWNTTVKSVRRFFEIIWNWLKRIGNACLNGWKASFGKLFNRATDSMKNGVVSSQMQVSMMGDALKAGVLQAN